MSVEPSPIEYVEVPRHCPREVFELKELEYLGVGSIRVLYEKIVETAVKKVQALREQ